MKPAPKFRFHGLSAGDRMRVMRKEIELLGLEIQGHKEMLGQLVQVMNVAYLTSVQAKAVSEEMEWRRRAIRVGAAMKKRKQDMVGKLVERQRQAQQRMQAAQEQCERQAA